MSHPSTWDLAVKEFVKDFRSLDTNAILKYFLPRAAFETTPCALWSEEDLFHIHVNNNLRFAYIYRKNIAYLHS